MSRLSASTIRQFPGEQDVRRTTWLQVVCRLDPKFGGISALMPRFCQGTRAVGVNVTIAGFCGPDEDTREIENWGFSFSRFPLGGMRWWNGTLGRGQLNQLLRSSDGLHIHGIWDDHSAASGALARSAGKPYIVSAHGMLERWAVKHKWMKKWLYSLLIERGNLRQAACLHALTKAEVGDYRRYGLEGPIAVIPNGVDIQPASNPEMFLDAYPLLRGKRLVVFLSRIHRKKGLDILCTAWRNLHHKFGDAQLVVAGPDFENTRSEVQALVADLGIAARVTFTGMLGGAMKWSALAAAEVFVLPSYSEGFSVAVLEAMGTGVPVVISRPCNFPEVADQNCGLVIDANAAELEDALCQMLSARTSDLALMGGNGRQLVAARYSWSTVGHQMAELYDWVLGGPEPVTVPIY